MTGDDAASALHSPKSNAPRYESYKMFYTLCIGNRSVNYRP